jgi:antitoxin CcdA
MTLTSPSGRDTDAAKRPVNLTLNSDLVARARGEGLNLSALAKAAVSAALAQRAREKLAAEIAEACRAHELYLADYGSLADAVAAADAA